MAGKRYGIGRIYPTKHKTWRAWINRDGRRLSVCLPTLGEARAWIDHHTIRFLEHAPPLQAAQLRDAAEALEILPPGVTLADAARAWKQSNPFGHVLLADAVAAYLRAKEASNLRPDSVRSVRSYAPRLARDFPGANLADITPGVLLEWFHARNFQPVNWNNYRRNLGTFFRWCIRMNWLSADPAGALPHARHDPGHAATLSPEQARALLAAAREHDPKMLPYITLGLFAGLRPAETRRLHWTDIGRPEPGQIHIAAHVAKTRTQARYVEITPNCQAFIDCSLEILHPASPRLDPHPPTLIVPMSFYVFRERFNAVRLAAGIDPWPQDALRHSYGAHHLALHQDAARTAHQMGHRSTAMLYAHYRNLVIPARAAAYFGIFP